ncbi:LPXTG cell wall anchor domain-containing protein [Blautia sp. RD014234]|nr:LPXTG cell wall anchor domain-containing protein [Blautia parvula]
MGEGDWTKEKATVRSPKTGDDTALFLTAVLCLGSAAAAYAVWKWRKQ